MAESPHRNRIRIVRLLAVGATAFVGALAVTALSLAEGSVAGVVLHRLFEPLCHQMPERSFTVEGGPVPVCARCTGLYVGGWLALVAAALPWGRSTRAFAKRPSRRWLVAAALPTGVDWMLGMVGLPASGNGLRAILALPAGFALALWVALAILEESRPRRTHTSARSAVLEEETA